MRHTPCTEVGIARTRRSSAVALVRRAEWFMGGAIALAFAFPSLAGPEGAQVVNGDVRITRNGNHTLIQASNNSIINYRSFDIGRNESVRFLQPNSSSRVLNRIESANPTRIDGSLSSNGRVYFVNPAGVYFGQGAVVNVAGLYAGAAQITNQAFLRNMNQFTNAQGSVINEGTIIADFVGLVGKSVINRGSIVAPQGAVVMGAGRDVLIGEGGGNVYVRVSGEAQPAQGEAAAVVNSGTIDATGGKVRVGVGDVYGAALFNAGTIRARSTRLEGQGKGDVKVAGTIDASNSNGKGGDVRVLGERVALENATIDARGTTGGGEVLVGGNFQGRGPERNAQQLSVSSDSSIHADATQRGDGGKVVLWSNEHTDYQGSISARGGKDVGNGGSVEVSGKETLAFRGHVNAGADHGRGGHLLLDPKNITVQTGGSDPATGQTFAGSPASSVTIDPTAITLITDTGTSVTLQANNDITINNAITTSAGGSGGDINLLAGRSILINANITTDNGALNLTANASLAGALGANRDAGVGSVTVGSGAVLNTGTGALNVVVESAASGPFSPGSLSLRAVTAGDAALFNTAGDISLLGAMGLTGSFLSTGVGFSNAASAVTTAGGTISINHTGAVAIGGNLTSAGGAMSIAGDSIAMTAQVDAAAGNVTLNAASGGVAASTGKVIANGLRLLGTGTFVLTHSTNSVDTIAANINGPLTFTNGADFTIGSVLGTTGITTASNNASFASGGQITIGQSINAGTGAISFIATNGATQTPGSALTASSLTLTGVGTFDLQESTNNVDSIAAAISGSLSYVDADALTVGATGISLTGATPTLSLVSGGAMTLTGNVRAIGGTAALDSANGISQGGSSAITVGSLSVRSTGNVSLNATSNDAQFLAANVDGAFTYRDADGLTISTVNGSTGIVAGTINLVAGGELYVAQAVRALNGSLTALSNSRLAIGSDASATTNLALWSGTGGSGDLDFDPAARISSPIITLRAGDGLAGNGTAAVVNAFFSATDGPFFSGASPSSSPTVFTIRQDGAIDALPLSSQFGASTSAIAYTLQSDDSGINLASAQSPLSLLGADLTLNSAAGSSIIMAGEFSLNSLNANGPVILRGAISGANLTFTDLVTFGLGSPSTLFATTGVVALQNGFDAQNSVTFRGKEIDIGAASTGTGALTFTSSNATSIRVGDAANNPGDSILDITQSELDFLAAGSFAAFKFGSSDFTGSITFAPAAPLVFNRAIEFRTDVGGSTTLLADVLTSGHAISIASDVILGAPSIRIDSTNFGAAVNGADITFAGTLNSDSTPRNLVIQGGAVGNVAVNGIAGLLNPLASLTAAGRTLAFNAVRTNGSQAYFGDAILSGDLSTANADSPITIRGNVGLSSDVSIVTGPISSGDGIFIDGGIDSLSRGAPRSLLLRSNSPSAAGNITVTGEVGSTAPLQDATLDGNSIHVQGLAAGGFVSLTGTSILADGLVSGGVISFTGPSTINGGVAGGTATFTGATTLNSDISGSTIAFNSPVTLGSDVIITASNSVAFEDTLDASPGSGLIIRSPQSTFDGDVGLTGILDQLIVQSTVPGARVSFTGSGTRFVQTTNGQSYDPDVITSLDAVFRSATNDIAFRARLDSQPGGARREVRLELPGTALFSGAVGFLNPLQSLVVATSNATLPTVRFAGSGVTTIAAQTYDGPTILASDAIFTGNSITFAGTIDSDSASTPRRFELNAGSGPAILQGNAGLNATLGAVFVSGSSVALQGVRASGRQVYTGSTITLNGSLFSLATGDIRFEGPVRLLRDVTVRTFGTSANDDITFTSTADGSAGVFSLDANAGLGDLFFGGSIGQINGSNVPSIRDLRLRGSAGVTLQGVSTSGLQQYNGPVILNSNLLTTGSGGILFNNGVTLNNDSLAINANAGGITFAQGVDSSANTNRSLTLTSSGGPVSLLGSIGGVTRLNTLSVNGNFVLLVGPEVRTTSIQSYNAPVQIGGNTRFEGSVLTFSSTLDSASSAARSVTINSTASAGGSGQVNFLGAIGALFPLQSLTVSSGITRVASNISTRNGIEFANAVNLSGNSIMDSGNGAIFFRSTLDSLTDFAGSSLELRSNLAATPRATPYRFGGNVGASGVLGTLTIGASGPNAGLPAPASAATIVFSDAWDSTGAIAAASVAASDSFEVRASNFVMGRNQKLTSFGNFLIRGTGSDTTSAALSASLGDITALGILTVQANTITLLTRPGGTLLDNFGQSDRDSGLDFVASGRISFSSTPVGGNSTVQFANNDANVSPTLNGFVVRQYTNGVAPVLFQSGSNLLGLDLKAEGPSLANTATILAAAIPRDEDLRNFSTPSSIDRAMETPLAEMGITTRDLDPDEQLLFLVGTSLYNDLSPPASMGGGDVSISSARLDRDSVERAVAGYRSLFLAPMLDENGNQVIGSDGRPAFDPDSKPAVAERLRASLAAAWTAYVAKDAQPSGEGFRAFLESQSAIAQERAALDILDRARDLLDDIDAMGLAPFEARGPKAKILEAIRPQNMTLDQLRSAVMGQAMASR